MSEQAILGDRIGMQTSIICRTQCIAILLFRTGLIARRQHFISVLFVSVCLSLISKESVVGSWISASLVVAAEKMAAYARIQNVKWKQDVFAR